VVRDDDGFLFLGITHFNSMAKISMGCTEQPAPAPRSGSRGCPKSTITVQMLNKLGQLLLLCVRAGR
jgi:hypothetical protein